jgi:hypothetical protein
MNKAGMKVSVVNSVKLVDEGGADIADFLQVLPEKRKQNVERKNSGA